ncbi:transposase, Ptta/En/Spm, plant [Spatholobus suberectus]|nr:transposase, Ptta/En/Spm, plant [Spatholobus suberectus]
MQRFLVPLKENCPSSVFMPFQATTSTLLVSQTSTPSFSLTIDNKSSLSTQPTANTTCSEQEVTTTNTNKVRWRLEHEDDIKTNFHSKAFYRLFEMFMEARRDSKRPEWIEERVWNSLLAHWNAPSYRSKCAQAQKNRASEKGGSLHTGGSISIQSCLVGLHMLMRSFNKPIYGRKLVSSSMIDLGGHMPSLRLHPVLAACFHPFRPC